MKPATLFLSCTILSAAALLACGQTQPPAAAPLPPSLVGPVSVAPDVRDLLKILHDRKDSLKDFTAAIDYSGGDEISGISGKIGTVAFIMDAARGATFTVDFTDDTVEGKVKRKHHQQIIFDGREVTTKDFDAKEVIRVPVLPPGAKPGDAVALNGPLTLPIGLDVEDVIRNFEVTLLPGADAKTAVLRLIPRGTPSTPPPPAAPGAPPEARGGRTKFDFKELEITVDKTLQLPIKMKEKQNNGEVMTIILKDIKPNEGKARMESSATPTGWTERK